MAYSHWNSINKYGAKKTECLYGHTHDSKKEAERCNELNLLQRAGEINSLEFQKPFLLLKKQKYDMPMKSEQKAEYKADFYYYDCQLKKWVIEDSKGHRTKDYVLKRKLVYASTDTTENDFAIEFVSGVKAGMTRSEIEALFQSAGDTTKTYTYYANKDAALLIFYDENDTATEIYLFADYDFMPILYSEKEEPVVEEMTEKSTKAAVEVISPESAMQVGR